MLSHKSRLSEDQTSPPSVEAYLIKALAYVAERTATGQTEVIPSLLASYLRLSSLETLAILMVLEDEGVLSHFYRIYCRSTDGVIGEFKHKKEIPSARYCRFCDSEHSEEASEVEIVFRVNREKLNEILRKRAVA
jgi:hypothetical protein